MTYIQLAYSDLILPALLVVMNGALSLALHLKLERQLAVAAVRMVVQLVLVGYVLTFLFAAVSPFWTALAAFIMVIFASREIIVRQKRRLQGLWTYGLGAGCTLLAAGTVTMFSLLISGLQTLRVSVRSRAALQLEILALRHQLQVLQRPPPACPLDASRPAALDVAVADLDV